MLIWGPIWGLYLSAYVHNFNLLLLEAFSPARYNIKKGAGITGEQIREKREYEIKRYGWRSKPALSYVWGAWKKG